MRKKFLAMYALVGALVASPIFTSCIDEGEESASVTAARDAKSAQIKATAEYEKQMNELNLALKQLQLEAEQANAEKVKHEVEAAIAEAKKKTAQYTKEMYQYQDDILTELTGNYTGALDNVVKYKEQIIKKKADVVALEQGLVDVQEYIVEQTELLNKNIAATEAKIAIWKDAEGGINEEELFAEKQSLQEKENKLGAEKTALEAEYGSMNYFGYEKHIDDYTDSNGDWHDGLNTLYENNPTNLATIEAIRGLYKLGVRLTNENNNNETVDDLPNINDDGDTTLDDNEKDWSFLREVDGYVILKQADITYFKQSKKYGTHANNLEYTKEDVAKKEAELGTEADKADTKYQATETTMDYTLYAKLAAKKEALVAPEKAYTEKKAAYEKALADYNAKETALSEAQAALTANTDATKTDALTAAVTAAQTAATTAETAKNEAYAAYTPTEQPYEDAVAAVEAAELAIAKQIDYINERKGYIAGIQGEEAENEAKIDEWIAAFEGEDYEAYKAAVDALDAKQEEIDTVKAELDAVNKLYYNGTDVEALIADAEADIAEYKEQLAAIEKEMSVPGTGNGYIGGGWDYYSEAEVNELIALVKEQIVSLEAKLEYEEIRAEQAKAALDAYLATLDATTEEAA